MLKKRCGLATAPISKSKGGHNGWHKEVSAYEGVEIRFIDEKHAADINIPNEPFPIRGRMVITYNGDRWEHTEKLLPSEQIEEMTFPDERWKKF